MTNLDEGVAKPGAPPASRPLPGTSLLVVAAIAVPALAVRLFFFDYRSEDYVDFYRLWYAFIEHNGGFGALQHKFSAYNVPYLYLLAVTVQLRIPPLVAVKLISVVFDIVLGWYSYRILRMRYPSGWAAPAGAAVVVLLPTVVVNSSMWGQCDSSYAAFSIGGLYYLLQRRHWTACSFFGLALAFKLQVVFLFPVLLLLAVGKRLPWRTLAAVPGVYLLLDVPALLLGAKPVDLLRVYYDQASLLRGKFIVTAPSAFQYLGSWNSETLQKSATVFTGLLVLALIALIALRRVELTDLRVLLAATASVLLVPFLLPNMHERYFYLADVLTVITAFWLPRRLWYVPILTQFASLFAYIPYLLLPYRLRDLTGDRHVANGSGFTDPPPGTGWLASAMRDASDPLKVLRRLFHPVISYEILATAILVALVATVVVTAREFRPAPEPNRGSGLDK
ncbi:glycosyltransferase 87 family protein [Actinomadura violacea]|uniref:DUF2029 domain-containing protein n=1 Tax=Actinomadura violacea TaxID=2819934 RepID=A0ABS3S0X0_9ACTN|nr:glycosyltransferase 87 family protein [Actinomadura violacea]MBO2462652.1 DUF2029 domain-containing protein [Actinomadura violacea]